MSLKYADKVNVASQRMELLSFGKYTKPSSLGMSWGMVILASPALMLPHSAYLESTPVTKEVAGISRSQREVMVEGVKSIIREHSISGKIYDSENLRSIEERLQTISDYTSF